MDQYPQNDLREASAVNVGDTSLDKKMMFWTLIKIFLTGAFIPVGMFLSAMASDKGPSLEADTTMFVFFIIPVGACIAHIVTLLLLLAKQYERAQVFAKISKWIVYGAILAGLLYLLYLES